MKKLIAALAVLVSYSVCGQTLFYYGNDSVSSKEFLRAYHKNNTGTKNSKALDDYLNLYIASRLKIKEAKARGYDTLPQLVADLDNLRQQIIPNYLNDKESVNRLVNEAFTRSQKDIHIAHIFISFTSTGVFDSTHANARLREVMQKLNENLPFEEVARQYSDDPSAKTNGGDIGFITVFSLPYELENLAYSTPVGKLSTVYRSKAGYHLLKNLGEQKDPGKLKVAQILLAFPPNADDQTRKRIKVLADSLYLRLQKGDDMAKLATLYSNDVTSASANGQMPSFGVGQYDPIFEKAAFSLKENGELTRPFVTSHGYHIVKRISREPVNSVSSDTKAMQALRDKVLQSDRMKSVRSVLVAKIIKEAGYRKYPFKDEDLWIYTDSVVNYLKPQRIASVNSSTNLFKLGDRITNVAEWINYVQTFRYKPDGSGIKAYPVLWDEFVESVAIDYYQKHLESFNEEFRQQIAEFREGNLFFEIMQRQVWGPAQSDTLALEQYYNKNENKYNWNKSADAVVFYASDAAAAKTFATQLKASPARWKMIASGFGEKITADSSRFELSQLPHAPAEALRSGTVTSMIANKTDNTISFAYVIKIYEQPEHRTFTEAKAMVINDYQDALEKEWLASLMKKYPVKINEEVKISILKSE